MAQDKEEKKTEDETYKAEAVHRLELAKADEKRIREEIEALKKGKHLRLLCLSLTAHQ